MDGSFNQQPERGEAQETRPHQHQQQPQPQQQPNLCQCLPQLKHSKPHTPTSVSAASVSCLCEIPRTLRRLCHRARFSSGSCLKRPGYDVMLVNDNSVVYGVLEEGDSRMAEEGLNERRQMVGVSEDGCQMGTFGDLIEEERRRSCSSSEFLTSEATGHEKEDEEEDEEEEEEEQTHGSSEVSSSSPSSSWPMQKPEAEAPPDCSSDNGVAGEADSKPSFGARQLDKERSTISEIELMKERFSKLLLGEDMSGCGNGVCTALAISNAITNLCATLFGQLWRLEPLPPEKKSMWRREMNWLLCVSDHIVELVPIWQTFPDGTKLEVMTCRPRSDLYVNLPALRKLDNMLLEILDGFEHTEFWYVDQGILALDADGSSSFRQALQRQEEKWWLPVPRVPPGGLHENSRKHLQHKRDCTNQILKAAMAINSATLAEMEVPQSYLEALPKNGRACLGDSIYRHITSDQFSPECLLDCLDLSSEHQAIEIANRIEASIYVWRKRTNSKPGNNANRSSSKSSWELVKELMVDGDKRELLAERVESLLLCLKQWFPGLPQTTLDMSKIQYNKDVGKSILESYSRVLESLAFNIVARIDDVLYVDDLTKDSDNFSSINKVGLIAQKSITIPYSVTVSGTPYRANFKTPSFSPAHLFSPAKPERSPFISSGKLPQRALGVKKVLTDYTGVIDTKGKDGKSVELDSSLNAIAEVPASPIGQVSPSGNWHAKESKGEKSLHTYASR